ncbi:unnamed protein product [Blepharisma stoltei]|uniref:CRC domain-containing protein n=1 Tax=Blepharisma stoltei TaxID=1481888 RepID=A0AAU9JDH1_9CILI|nr:unnamed protein product [Blepharisma stoltei]
MEAESNTPKRELSPFTQFCLTNLSPIDDYISFYPITTNTLKLNKLYSFPQKRALSSLTPKCACKRSQCLKMYCECFAANSLCADCDCIGCSNIPIEDETKLISHEKLKIVNVKHQRGCSCKRSNCRKKYCECYQKNLYCKHFCKCLSCENM